MPYTYQTVPVVDDHVSYARRISMVCLGLVRRDGRLVGLVAIDRRALSPTYYAPMTLNTVYVNKQTGVLHVSTEARYVLGAEFLQILHCTGHVQVPTGPSGETLDVSIVDIDAVTANDNTLAEWVEHIHAELLAAKAADDLMNTYGLSDAERAEMHEMAIVDNYVAVCDYLRKKYASRHAA